MQKKILVVDDDPFIVEFITEVLVQSSYNVLAAFNGESALDLMQKEEPDLVIMDWEMPGIDGIETLVKKQKIDAIVDVPVIMITGRMTSIDDLKKALEAGAVDFIRKPIEPVELVARSRSMLMLSGYYKESIRKKEWELTTLATTNHQNESLFNDLVDIIDQFYSECSGANKKKLNILKEKVSSIKSNFRNNSWEQLESYFKNVHPNFAANLVEAYPNLSSEEIRLCYFLKMNMSSKDIAAITNKEMHSVDIARYRLRKKLGIDRSVKLNVFLAKL